MYTVVAAATCLHRASILPENGWMPCPGEGHTWSQLIMPGCLPFLHTPNAGGRCSWRSCALVSVFMRILPKGKEKGVYM